MRFPERAQEIVTRRTLMRLMAEQLAFELGPAYGVKSAGAGRPQGPSQIAYNGPDGLGSWRILDGDGSVTDVPNSPIPNPTWQAFPGQIFIPVDPIDHLGVRPAPPALGPLAPPVVEPPVVPPPATPVSVRAPRKQGGFLAFLLKLIFRRTDR
jgi:hypothetical protein